MSGAQHDGNEADRLDCLRFSGALSSPTSASLDALTEIVRQHFEAPASFVSLVDDDTCWMTSESGSSFGSLSREMSICDTAIRSDSVLVIEDLSQDARFRTRAYVAGPPHLRFYAGAPIIYELGIRLGAVCIMDTKPRKFSRGDRAELQLYADKARSAILEQEFRIG